MRGVYIFIIIFMSLFMTMSINEYNNRISKLTEDSKNKKQKRFTPQELEKLYPNIYQVIRPSNHTLILYIKNSYNSETCTKEDIDNNLCRKVDINGEVFNMKKCGSYSKINSNMTGCNIDITSNPPITPEGMNVCEILKDTIKNETIIYYSKTC